jgi:hypothetical protein
LDELLRIESYLRRQRYIAHADLATKVLWAFEADEGSGNFAKEITDLDAVSKFSRLEGAWLALDEHSNSTSSVQGHLQVV